MTQRTTHVEFTPDKWKDRNKTCKYDALHSSKNVGAFTAVGMTVTNVWTRRNLSLSMTCCQNVPFIHLMLERREEKKAEEMGMVNMTIKMDSTHSSRWIHAKFSCWSKGAGRSSKSPDFEGKS